MSGSKQSVILSDIKSSVSGRLRKVWRTLPKERQDSIKEVLHPATVAKIRRLLASTRDASKGIVVQEPVVTIGIALSRTDHKIEATLRSLISQKINALEILVIDSTNDRSIGEIVAEYCSRDGRIRSIKAENSSFDSACRLSEINSAAPYILFLSAGDIVSPNSIKTMYETVCTTRSDFVTGRPSLFKGKKATLPALQRRIYLETQLSASLQDIPVLLSDNFINNKIFSRQFWRSINTNDLTTGEYWSYEVLKRVYLSSSAFDIVSTDFVSTSNPNGGPALTRESLCELSTLDTFIMRIDSLDNYFRDRVSTDLYQQWITHEFGNGLFPHFEVLPRVGEEYWSRLHETVVKYCSVESINWGDLRLHNRIILSMVLAGSREDVETICVSRSDYGSSFPVTFNGSKMVANPQYLSHLATDVDSRLLLCNPVDLQMMAKMNHFVWLPEGELCVGGYAYVSGVDPSDPAFSVEVAVVDSDGVVLAQFDVVRGNDEQIDWNSNDNWTSYGASAFQAKINIKDVLDLATGGDKSELRVQVTLHLQDFKWVEFLSKRDTTGASGTLPVGPILGGQRLAVEFRPKTTGLTFFRLSPKIVANSVALTKRHLNLTVGSNNVSANTKLVIECKKLGIKKSVTPSVVGSDLLKFSLRLPELDATVSTRTEFQWQIRLVSKSGKSTPLAWKGDSGALAAAIDQTQSLSVSLTGYGFLTLTERKMRIFADEVIVAPDKRSITIHGTASLPVIQAPRFVLTSGKAIIAAESSILHLQYTDSSNRFTAKFLLPQTPWSSDELMPEPGAYSVRYVPRGSDDAAGYWIPASPALQSTMPYRLNAGRVEVGISRSPVTAALTVHLRPPLASNETGRYNQQQLRATLIEGVDDPLVNSILFMCFGGNRATDSPRRILEHFQSQGIAWPMYWAITSHSVSVPSGTIPLVIGSTDWFRALKSARVLINNNNFPFYFRKRPGQVYFQTWHGTPLKKLGNDVARTNFSLSYWNLMWREAGFWDALLAQNDYAADTLAKCFGFEGPVINTGYPRNDSLSTGNSSTLRNNVRQKLGVPDGKTAILYAPTWRDDAKNDEKSYELVTYLDFQKAQKLLGDEYVILLRGHHNIAAQRQTASNRFVIDVTEYPEVNDLYLAADILINDYSSVMFDFCVTRKPILFLTPDIAQYRDSTRGFYFDLEQLAPGPLLKSTTEIVRAIKKISDIETKYADKYDNFVEKFAPNCDGNATSRVVESLWPDLTGSFAETK